MALNDSQLKAVAHFCEKGYRPEMSVYPNYRFTNRETGEIVTQNIFSLVAEYKAAKKEEAKERARSKKMEGKGNDRE